MKWGAQSFIELTEKLLDVVNKLCDKKESEQKELNDERQDEGS